MTKPTRFPLTLYLLIMSSGLASLSWEVLWQIKSTLALGVSAWGAAITLAIVMGGMSIGGYFMGNLLRHASTINAIKLYGLLEICAGIAGIFLNPAFQALEHLDTWGYSAIPNFSAIIYIGGIGVILGIPTLCMGATIPVFGLIAAQYQLSLAKLYSLNTFGAAFGVLLAALLLIPLAGMTHTIWLIAGINLAIGAAACWLLPNAYGANTDLSHAANQVSEPLAVQELILVFVTGFATFALEIAWFRSFATVFPNTTDIFAIILACLLIALGLAAKKIPTLKDKKYLLGTQLWMGGILILFVTPIIERLDILFGYTKYSVSNTAVTTTHLNWLLSADTYTVNRFAIYIYIIKVLVIFSAISCLIIPPMRFLGVALPWLLDKQRSAKAIGKLYAVNTLAAMLGSIGAAWFLLPTIGFAKTSVLASVLVLGAGCWITPGRKKFLWGGVALVAIVYAFYFDAGIGRVRVQGLFANIGGQSAKVLESSEGPASTVSVVEQADGARMLLINSALASVEFGDKFGPSSHYMSWMGSLPMLHQADPKQALVICFGSGQTANAVRKENPNSLDIVDVDPQIFKLAHYFRSNEGVLNDPRVHTITMDGRAYLRRTQKIYDVITLEPMPPTMAGVNALYSKEFYALARARLSPNGVIAQWLPFHAVAPHYAASIAKTFISVFPNAILWIDPVSQDGILLGSNASDYKPTQFWPGFVRNNITRNLTAAEVNKSIIFGPQELAQYGAYGEIISDDNQLLAYGKVLYAYTGLKQENLELIHRIATHN